MKKETPFKAFTLDGHKFQAQDCVDGVLIDPKLPRAFDDTPNEVRPKSQGKWIMRPYIVTDSVESWDAHEAQRTDEYAVASRARWVEDRVKWLQAYPSGVRYDVRCLDYGCWDRSTNWGAYQSVEEALAAIQGRPRRDYREM